MVTNPLKKSIDTFKPVYVWPNPAFPWRLYYDGKECRIFIIENIGHNWEWLKQVSAKIKHTDYFFVYIGCHYSESLLKDAIDIFELLKLNRNNFFIMFNDSNDKRNFEKHGFNGEIINQNCWLDWNFTFHKPTNKIYDAIYVGRLISLKRHYLANKVENLALVSGNLYGEQIKVIPNHVYLNESQLTEHQVFEKINQSKCGLILSSEEGACFSSSEYLLCGVPVVSTKSLGGRDLWYDSYNSKIVEDNVDAVKAGVQYFIDNTVDGNLIRQKHIETSVEHRERFILKLNELFLKFNVKQNARDYFNSNFYHKIRKSYDGKLLMEHFK